MGSLFSPPKINIPPPPAIPPSANPPILADASVRGAGADQKSKAALANGMGFSGTVQNEGAAAGLTEPANTAKRSLLG